MEIRQASRDDAVAIVENLWLPFAQEMAELDDYNHSSLANSSSWLSGSSEPFL